MKSSINYKATAAVIVASSVLIALSACLQMPGGNQSTTSTTTTSNTNAVTAQNSNQGPARTSTNANMMSEDVTPIQWDTSAAGFNGEQGQRYTFRCPAKGVAGSVWGNDVYTADSSICTAAVHAGKINLADGGVVTIEIRPGRSTYGSTKQNDITSTNFGEYGRSFVFVSTEAGAPDKLVTAQSSRSDGNSDVTAIQWDTSAAGFNGEPGKTYTFRCPGGGTAHSVWGSDIYTADSSICTAAVHAGKINLAEGGVVTIELRPGRAIYGSTKQHDITSTNFGEYGRSFVFR